jgi:5-(carboxyamino)imidazole ribonucleotide synthase
MVGAGQLARMTAQAAVSLGIGFRVLAAEPGDSAAQVCAGVQIGDYRSADDLRAFARSCDVVTFDHEHVPGPLLAALEQEGHRVRPAREALRYAQDKLAMRQRLAALGVACPRWARVDSADDVAAFAEDSGWPVVLKAVSGGYDGKGVWVCATPDEAADVLAHGIDLMAEEYVAFERELAVQTIQQDGICREVLAPAPGLDGDTAVAAEQIGLAIAAGIGVTGMLAVELFQTPGGLLVNELAMRPHNSGHWTIEGATTSQFEQHLRAVLDLPLGSPAMAGRHAVMANVLGGDDPDLHGRLIHVMAADPGVKVHLYGKAVRPGRKVGHVTAVGDDVEDLRRRAWRAASYLRDGTEQD